MARKQCSRSELSEELLRSSELQQTRSKDGNRLVTVSSQKALPKTPQKRITSVDAPQQRELTIHERQFASQGILVPVRDRLVGGSLSGVCLISDATELKHVFLRVKGAAGCQLAVAPTRLDKPDGLADAKVAAIRFHVKDETGTGTIKDAFAYIYHLAGANFQINSAAMILAAPARRSTTLRVGVGARLFGHGQWIGKSRTPGGYAQLFTQFGVEAPNDGWVEHGTCHLPEAPGARFPCRAASGHDGRDGGHLVGQNNGLSFRGRSSQQSRDRGNWWRLVFGQLRSGKAEQMEVRVRTSDPGKSCCGSAGVLGH
eukprot:3208593-Amphidinium_carterae.2